MYRLSFQCRVCSLGQTVEIDQWGYVECGNPYCRDETHHWNYTTPDVCGCTYCQDSGEMTPLTIEPDVLDSVDDGESENLS